MNCNQCIRKMEDGEVNEHFYCLWHHDWIPNKCIDDLEDCRGFVNIKDVSE